MDAPEPFDTIRPTESEAHWEISAFEQTERIAERNARRRLFRRFALPWFTASGLSVLTGVAIVHLGRMSMDRGAAWMCLGTVIGCVLAGVGVLRSQRIRPFVNERDLDLLDGFGHGQCILVQLTIRCNGVKTGVDRGVVWLEDRRLCFAGHCTSFALGGAHTVSSEFYDKVSLFGVRASGVRIEVNRGSNKEVGIELAALVDDSSDVDIVSYRLANYVGTWRSSARPSDPTQFPPTTRGPGGPTYRALPAIYAVKTVGLWILVGCLSSLLLHTLGVVIVACAFLAWVLWWFLSKGLPDYIHGVRLRKHQELPR